ncbi:MAG TPA: RDD family protein [Bacteroidales bacterium]|nr:RDD family protein [Bacteroidales bacterium]
MTDNKYGKLINRVKAILVDTLVIIGLALAVSGILNLFENVSNPVRALCFTLIVLYDPILTTLNGATVGHMLIGLKVRKESDENQKISFPFALIRFVLKAFLGFISLMTISEKNKGKAIHDSAAGSIVLQS